MKILFHISVVKRPLNTKLEEFLVIEVYTDTDSVNSQTIDALLRDSVLNQDFETRIHSDRESVLCKYNSDLNLMKCELKIKSNSKKECNQKHCSSVQRTFDYDFDNDLQKIQTLLKTNEEVFKRKLNTKLIDFEVKRVEGNAGQPSSCPEGYYLYSKRCRESLC